MKASTVIGSTGEPSLSRSVMRHDQVLEPRAQVVGKLRYPEARLSDHHHAHRDVTEEVAVSRIAWSCRLGQLVQLADIVQDRTGKHQIAIGIVRTRQCVGGLRHFQDVVEEPALVRVMHGQRGWPAPKLRLHAS